MKKILILTLFTLLCVGIYNWSSNTETYHPQPTDTIVKTDADEEGNGTKKEDWFNLLHSSSPETNWRKIEHKNTLDRLASMSDTERTGGCDVTSYANGAVSASWEEKGSLNQTGSIENAIYDSIENKLVVIGAGGPIYTGDYEGGSWEVVNQDFKFDRHLLAYIDAPGGRRLLAAIDAKPHYSVDNGLTWTTSTGINSNDNWATTQKYQIIQTTDGPHIYAIHKPTYWDNLSLVRSIDYGASFQTVMTFNSIDISDFDLCKPHHTEILFIAEDRDNIGKSFIHQLNPADGSLTTIYESETLKYGDARTNLIGTLVDGQIRFYAYFENNKFNMSEDGGLTWTQQATLPIEPWSVAVFVSPTNPDLLLTGGVECFRSTDKGDNWSLVNGWAEYYDDVNGKLHADIMHFLEFRPTDFEADVILVSNHGGIHASYDYVNTVTNISLSGLNVSQYYDVKTDPNDPNYVYAGAQDQGFQRSNTGLTDGPIEFDQVISGDYGHIAFSQNGNRLWTVYPGGWLTYYANPHFGGVSASWENANNNSPVWIPPVIASPVPEENAVFMAGGSANNSGGSYLIKMNIASNQIQPTDVDYNFMSFSGGGSVSAIGFSKFDPNNWFVGTTNGRFFRSTDAGVNWEQTINFLPEGHYLYGAFIHTSKTDPNTLYYMGSGYDNPPVYKSTDGGETFTAMVTGLPPTLVFKIVSNQDESLLFAATEAGPYVYVHEDQQWYSIAGTCAPNQTYWSVEFIESLNKVRYGTYGRGIWDFNIDIMNDVANIPTIENLNVYPSPAQDNITIEIPQSYDNGSIEIYSMDMKLVQTMSVTNDQKIELTIGDLTPGLYTVKMTTNAFIATQKIVKK